MPWVVKCQKCTAENASNRDACWSCGDQLDKNLPKYEVSHQDYIGQYPFEGLGPLKEVPRASDNYRDLREDIKHIKMGVDFLVVVTIIGIILGVLFTLWSLLRV